MGWFGFNAGSAVAANGSAAMAMLVTHIGAAAGSLGWMLREWVYLDQDTYSLERLQQFKEKTDALRLSKFPQVLTGDGALPFITIDPKTFNN